MVPIDQYVKNQAVMELVAAFGRGELQHGAAQAAAWHLNSGVSWEQLASKLNGTERSMYRAPYFSRFEIQAGMAYANEAARRGQFAQMQRDLQGTGDNALAASSEAISSGAAESEKTEAAADSEEADKKAARPARRERTRRQAQTNCGGAESVKQP
jgi:hypothetical protein